jgi:hypothetical protein
MPDDLERTEIDEAALFQSAKEPAPAPAGDTGGPAEPAQDGQPRDERGRFATNKDEPPAQPSTEPSPSPQPPAEGRPPGADGEVNVPSWRLREEREAREAAHKRAEQAERYAAEVQRQYAEWQRQVQQQQQPKPEPIDPLVDPEGYYGRMRNEWRQEMKAVQLENNLQMAYNRHGDTFARAFQAFEQIGPQNPQWAASIVHGPNPGEALVNWFNREQVLYEVGPDPKAYRSKVLDEALKDPAFLAKAYEAARAHASGQQTPSGGRPQNITQLPPSLSRIAGSGPDPAMDNAIDDASLFRQALTPRK